MILLAVAMRAINHDARVEVLASFEHGISGALDVFSLVVRSIAASSQDDVHVWVAVRADDGGETLWIDTHESVRVGGGSHSVDGDADASRGSVLEADRERDTGGWKHID